MRLLTFAELKPKKGIPYCRDHLRRLVKAHQFPQPIDIGPRRIAWFEGEVDEHLETLAARRASDHPRCSTSDAGE
jgi:prophage regulatory protein